MPDGPRAGLLYFAIVFTAGCTLGPLRVLWAEPRFGMRIAELLEAPFMLAAILLAARWTARRLPQPRRERAAITAGSTALALLVAAEATVVIARGGTSLARYVADRDPVSGTVYLVLVALFASMPWLMVRLQRSAA